MKTFQACCGRDRAIWGRMLWVLPVLLLPLKAQEPGVVSAPADPPGRILEWLSPPEHFHLDLKRRVLHIVGNVHVRTGGIVIRCDNFVAWGVQPGEGEGPHARRPTPANLEKTRQRVKEIYAEGTVIITEGSRTWRAERVYLDLRHERGILIDAGVRMPLRTRSGEMPLFIRAGEVRILARDLLQARDAQVTTSPFAEPTWHFRTENLEIAQGDPIVIGEGEDAREIMNVRFQADGNTLYLGNFPVIWFPDVGGDTITGGALRYIRSVRVNQSSRFGTNLGLTVGDDVRDASGRPWGRWRIMLDHFSRRGFGPGIDIEYKVPSYEGRLLARYQRDEGRDQFYGVPPTKNRGRISFWHRQRFGGGVQLDIEGNLFSDRGFFNEWYERDRQRDKPPENLLYVKKPFFNSMLSARVSERFDDWLTRTVRQPEVQYDLIAEPLVDVFGETLYLSTSALAGNVALKFDDALDRRTWDSWRVEVQTLAELPILVDPFKITPFAGLNYTWYENDFRTHRPESELGATFGATLSTQIWRDFDSFGGLFGLDGLRHVILPQLTWMKTINRDVPDLPEADIFTFENVERSRGEEFLELRVRNLLQTLRHGKRRTYVDTFLDLETWIRYFPDTDNDNDGRSFSNLNADLLLRFSEELQFQTDLEVNWYGKGFEVLNLAAGYIPSRDFQAYAGFRHFGTLYDEVFLQVNWRPEEKWLVTFETSYDLEQNRGIEHRLRFDRIGPDWIIELVLKADVGQNDYGVSFSFRPRMLFNPVERPGSISNRPRFLYLQSGLQR